MRVLFIVPYPTEGPSNRFRVEQYLPALREKGVEFKVRAFYNARLYAILHGEGRYLEKLFYLAGSTMARLVDIFRSINYDIVFIHREAFPSKDPVFEWLFRLFAKKIIYDFDDAIFLTKPAKVRMLLRTADHVIAGNAFLREESIRYNKNVTILPTPIDTDRYLPAFSRPGRKKVVIGWIGTSTTFAYLASVSDVFRRLSEKYENVEFRAVGAGAGPGPSALINRIKWHLESEVGELQGFDIGIMPMPENDWTKGKCAFKILEYMAVGIPSVASPVGMNKEVITDGLNGFLVSTDKGWFEKLSALIESPSLRESIGRKGRETVEKIYSLGVSVPKMLSIFEKIFEEGR